MKFILVLAEQGRNPYSNPRPFFWQCVSLFSIKKWECFWDSFYVERLDNVTYLVSVYEIVTGILEDVQNINHLITIRLGISFNVTSSNPIWLPTIIVTIQVTRYSNIFPNRKISYCLCQNIFTNSFKESLGTDVITILHFLSHHYWTNIFYWMEARTQLKVVINWNDCGNYGSFYCNNWGSL